MGIQCSSPSDTVNENDYPTIDNECLVVEKDDHTSDRSGGSVVAPLNMPKITLVKPTINPMKGSYNMYVIVLDCIV